MLSAFQLQAFTWQRTAIKDA